MNVYLRERLKTICIALLLFLLVLLTMLNFLYNRADLVEPLMLRLRGETVPAPAVPVEETLPEVILPVSAALRRDGALTAAVYDSSATDTVYYLYRSLLGMALASARDAEAVSPEAWRAVLRGDCAYFRFQSLMPAWLLAEMLSQEASPSLDGLSFDRLLLYRSGESGLALLLGTRDGFFRFETPLSFELPDLSEHSVRLQPAFFAFELSLPDNVPPDTLIAEHTGDYPALVPQWDTPDEAMLKAILSALGFNPNTDRRYPTDTGEQIFVDNQRVIHVMPDGFVTYRDNSPDNHGTTEPETEDSVRAALHALPQGEEFWGDGRLCLRSVDETTDGVTVTLSYLWHGALVSESDTVLVSRGGVLREAYIRLRPLRDGGEQWSMLPQRQAALLLPYGAELSLGYSERDGVYTPYWLYY